MLALSMILASCAKDNEEDLYPPIGDNCNTENVSYTQTVVPILNNNNCVSCHAGAGASGGIQLDSHNAVAAAAASGRLLGAIKHEAGYSAMPQGGSKLSDCEISQIDAWIAQGAFDN